VNLFNQGKVWNHHCTHIAYSLTLCLSLLSTEELWLLSKVLSLVSMYSIDTQWILNVLLCTLIVCLFILFAKQMIHEVNLLKVCLQRFNVFYSISMVSPITPKGYIFPHDFPFFSLYPVTAAVKVPMHDSDLHHAGKEEIARLPTVRQGIFWEMSTSSKGKKREKTRLIPVYLIPVYGGSTLSRLREQSRCQRVTMRSIKLPLYI